MTLCEPGKDTLIFAIIYGICAFILFITTVVTIGKLIKDERERRYARVVFYMTMIFCVDTSFLILLLATVFPAALCSILEDAHYLTLAQYTFLITYFIHIYLLWLLLLSKLYFLFKGTYYNMTRRTVTIWLVVFTVSMLSVFVMWLTSFVFLDVDSFTAKKRKTILWTYGIVWSLTLIVPISLSVSFISKLIHVYKAQNDHTSDISSVSASQLTHDDPILSIITKHTILTLLCIPITMACYFTSLYSIVLRPNDDGWKFLSGVYSLYLFNIYVNFICIVLSYDVFDGSYRKLCGWIDRACRQYCMHRMEEKEMSQMKDQYQRLYAI